MKKNCRLPIISNISSESFTILTEPCKNTIKGSLTSHLLPIANEPIVATY